jgi:hypothetical protein
MVSFSLRQRIFLPPPTGPAPVSFHLSQFAARTLFFSNLTCCETLTSLRVASMIFHLTNRGYA